MNRIAASDARPPAGASAPARGRCAGFTLVELLTVIAIIALLAAILVPTTAAVRTSAKRAKTKVQFGQWAVAMEQFRQEYGYYPAIDGGTGRVNPDVFAGALTGRTLAGRAPATASQLAGNLRQLRFYCITEGELDESGAKLADAFGNTDIAVIYDKNDDGMVDSADGEMVAVRGQGGTAALAPAAADLDLRTGVRARVIFYSAGKGLVPGDVVLSWK